MSLYVEIAHHRSSPINSDSGTGPSLQRRFWDISITATRLHACRQDSIPATVLGTLDWASLSSGHTESILTDASSPYLALRFSSPAMDQHHLATQQSLRILVAEGNPYDQQITLSQLQQLGYTADTVEDGVEVLSALQYIPYDVVFMDVQMPYMDGIATSHAIKTSHNPITCPWIVAMANRALPSDLHRMLDAGMDDYLAKPIELSALQEALMRCKPPNPSPKDSVISNTELNSEFGSAINLTVGSESTLEPIEAPKPVAIAPLDAWALQQVLHMVSHDPEGFFVTTIDYYLSEARQLLEFMHLAVRERDAVKLGRSAHTLKSSSATLGALDFARMCQALENLERSQFLAEADWEQAAQQVAQLEQDHCAVEQALQIERRKYQ